MAKRKARRRTNTGEFGHRVMPAVRPPQVPSEAEHQINLTRLKVKPSLLADWLGLTPQEVKSGVSPAIRLAIAYYVEHQNAANLRRISS